MLYKYKQFKLRQPITGVQYLPNSDKVKEIVEADYKKRVIDDIVGNLTSNLKNLGSK